MVEREAWYERVGEDTAWYSQIIFAKEEDLDIYTC